MGWCPCNGYKPIFVFGYGPKQRLLRVQKGNVPEIGTLPALVSRGKTGEGDSGKRDDRHR